MSCVEPGLTKMSSNQIVLPSRTPMYSFFEIKQSNLLVLQKKKRTPQKIVVPFVTRFDKFVPRTTESVC